MQFEGKCANGIDDIQLNRENLEISASNFNKRESHHCVRVGSGDEGVNNSPV